MDSPTRHIVVIGGGPAGTCAAIAAKKHDPAAHVSLVTDEACEPYEKPPLSKAVLLGSARTEDALIAGPGGLAAHLVELVCGARCVAIDREAREAVLADGRRLPYDALVITTGATARQIPQLPRDMPGIHYLRTHADAQVLKADLIPGRRLLVVGAGLIGLEVAASARHLEVETTVIEVAPRVLARVCDEETGAMIHETHRQHGVDIRLNTELVATARESDGRLTATFNTGDALTVDLIVVGVGAAPDLQLAASAGLAVDDGIVVDANCRTSVPGIFAAGDVVRFPGPDGPVRLENWRHAQDQGTLAGRNAAGAEETYATVPSFWSEQYDLYLQGVGWPGAGGTHVRRPLAKGLLVFDLLDGQVVYAMGVNAQRDVAFARRLIERHTRVTAAELADPAQPLAALLKR